MSQLAELVNDINTHLRSVNKRISSLENRENIDDVINEKMYFIKCEKKNKLVCCIKEFEILKRTYFIYFDGNYIFSDKLTGAKVVEGNNINILIREGKEKIYNCNKRKLNEFYKKHQIVNPK